MACAAPTFAERTIQPSFFAAQGVIARDFDGDGDANILGASFNGNKVSWFENVGAAC